MNDSTRSGTQSAANIYVVETAFKSTSEIQKEILPGPNVRGGASFLILHQNIRDYLLVFSQHTWELTHSQLERGT